ncbi:MAG: hypothetical protein Q8O74_00430 [bacterium]|nr:hypothetical protein [bacterium]
MRAIIALCSMILLFSFTGVQAQTDSVPVAGDSIQAPAPAVEPPITAESPAATAVPARPAVLAQLPKTDNSLTGVYLFSCNGLYFYNKNVTEHTDYYGLDYEVTYKTHLYAVLLNANYFVNNGFSFGMTLGVLSMASKSESERDVGSYYYFDDDYSTSVNVIGPRLAYYHGSKDSKVLPFAAFEYDILTSEFYSDNAMRIGAGVLLQPRPHLGISFGLDYLKFGEEEKSTNIMGVLGLTGILY